MTLLKFPTDRTVFQNAWVVDDVAEAMRHWVEVMGVGPFFVTEFKRGMLLDTLYRGRPADVTMKVAIAQAGPVQIELIEPVGEGPSCYRDTVKRGRNGFHHVCVWTHDFEADRNFYESRGFPAANMGRVANGMRFAYYDTSKIYDCMVEIIDHHPDAVARFKMIADAARDWDGRDPYRWGA